MLPKRHDFQLFEEAIEDLKAQQWLGSSRQWWPKYLFHFTDVRNAVQILNSGYLNSRNFINAAGGIPTDIANQGIITGTREDIKNYVRLYFKPRTPMQHSIEGFRLNSTARGHCPVPVIFMFGSKEVLGLRDSQFSEGNLGVVGTNLQSTITEFKNLPFQSIYHDFPVFDRRIIFHRHAEVVVPNQLPLDGFLKSVWCRSKSELDTLTHYLSFDVWQKYQNKLGSNPKFSLFYEKWPYINSVELSENNAKIDFHKPGRPSDLGPFKLRVDILSTDVNYRGNSHFVEESNFFCNQPMIINTSNIPYKKSYKVICYIDGHLAHSSYYIDFNSLF